MASELEDIKGTVKEIKPDPEIAARIKRGRESMVKGAAKRKECVSFYESDQYVNTTKVNGVFQFTPADLPVDKPYKIFTVHNLIQPIVDKEVSALTQRVPSYQVTPSTTDPQDIGAARISEKIALYLYDKCDVRRFAAEVVWWAVVGGEGFARAYFDNTIGDSCGPNSNGEEVSEGEICLDVYSPDEVYWEPGQKYERSKWFCIEQARPVYDVYKMGGYIGGKLTPDSTNSDVLNKGQQGSHLVLVTEYFEPPSQQNRNGRHVIMANGRVICPEASYPLVDPKTKKVCDEPLLVRFAYLVDAASDRALPPVAGMLDPQRIYNDCTNKALMWKNLAMNPQVLVPKGSMIDQDKLSEAPGQKVVYRGSVPPTWRSVGQVPPDLYAIADRQADYMLKLMGQDEIPTQFDSGKGVQAFIDNLNTRKQRPTADLAQFHTRLMRHMLWLAQRYYTEKRLISLRGEFGIDPIEDFIGADLAGQADVIVLPSSIEPHTREYVYQTVMNYAQMGWLTKEEAIEAIRSGTVDNLVRGYELQKSKIHRVIQDIRTLIKAPDGQMVPAIANRPMVPGPNGQEIPSWMPQPYDNVDIQMAELTEWMQTLDFERMQPGQMLAAHEIYNKMVEIKQQQAAQAAAAMADQSSQVGLSNATKAAGPTQMPSMPSVSPSAQ